MPSDYLKPRKLARVVGNGFSMVPLAPFAIAEVAGYRCYIQRGANTIELYPALDAPGDYRLTYVYKVTKLVNTSDVLDLPEGVERVLVQQAAYRCRLITEEENLAPGHLSAARDFWAEDKESLAKLYPDTTEGVVDVTGMYTGEVW